MAVTFTSTAYNSTGTAGTNVAYKDVTVTVASGDLVIAAGMSANANGSGTAALATQAGSAGSWTVGRSNNASESPGFVAGHAVASGAGSLTVRVTVPNAGGMFMGAGVWVVPAAEWTGTPAYTSFGTNIADPSPSVTLSTTSKVFYAGTDWSAGGDPGTSATPAGVVNDTTFFVSGNYGGALEHWLTQGAGTRDYGPSAPPGDQWTGVVVAVEEVGGGGGAETTGVLWGSGTPATGQSAGSWANPTNATGANDAARAVWTSTASGATGWIRVEGHGAQAAIGAEPASVDQVEVTVYAYTTNTTRMSSIAVQLADGGTLIGSAQTMTKSTSTTFSQSFVFTGVTWAQLANLGVRVLYTRGAVTTSATGNVDAVSINITYTPASGETSPTTIGGSAWSGVVANSIASIVDVATVGALALAGIAAPSAESITAPATVAASAWAGGTAQSVELVTTTDTATAGTLALSGTSATSAFGVIDSAGVGSIGAVAGQAASSAAGIIDSGTVAAAAWSGVIASSGEIIGGADTGTIGALAFAGSDATSAADVVDVSGIAGVAWSGSAATSSETIGVTDTARIGAAAWSGLAASSTADVIGTGTVAGVAWFAVPARSVAAGIDPATVAGVAWSGVAAASIGADDGSAVADPELTITIPAAALEVTIPVDGVTLPSSTPRITLAFPTTSLEVPAMGLHVNDTAPLFTAALTSAGAPVDLTGATIVLHLRKPSGAVATLAASADAPATGGTITGAAWTGPGALDEAGSWQVEVQVTYSDTTIQTFGPAAFNVAPELA